MYTLTLTKGEREAIDWVGHRYRHGNELGELLWHGCTSFPRDAEWDSDGDIEFLMSEPTAWAVSEIINDGLDCFGRELCNKLCEFQEKIV